MTKKLEPTRRELKAIARDFKARPYIYGLELPRVHLWDGITFDEDGHPVALCRRVLFPHVSSRDDTVVCKRCMHYATLRIREML